MSDSLIIVAASDVTKSLSKWFMTILFMPGRKNHGYDKKEGKFFEFSKILTMWA